MKYLDFFRTLVIASFIGLASTANGQSTSKPLSFPPVGTSTTPNWYSSYVGVRFQICAPSSIAGDKIYTTANDGSGGTTMWGGAPQAFVCQPLKFAGPVPDTNGCSPFAAGYFTGKIALIWRGTCEFGYKALQAQYAGAIAVVIVNNASGGPVGMGAGASGASVTIPVYMISLEDGLAIASQLNMGNPVTLTTLLTWSSGHANDLGLVPEGYSLPVNNATPYSQLNAHPLAYKGIDGAFVANYGTNDANNVKVKADLSWTPTGGSSSVVHSDSNTLESVFHVTDSVFTIYAAPYDLPTVTGPGQFDLTYTISSDSVDGFPGDNTVNYSFYATDSLYSKGRYDFANNRPYAALYTGYGGTNPTYIWGVPYYIANGGDVFSHVQFSVSSGPGLLNGLVNIYVFKWVDGSGSTPVDSLMQNDELSMIGVGTKAFDGVLDSSFQFFSVPVSGDTTNEGFDQVFTSSNSWYVIGAEVATGTALGLDGVVDGYPRAYGRTQAPGAKYYEYYNPIWEADRNTSAAGMLSNPTSPWYPWSFDGVGSYDIDSVTYSTQKGLIPALPFTTTSHISAVNHVSNFANVSVFPNPAADYVNVSVDLKSTAKKVTYTVINSSAQVVSKVSHDNVQNDKYTFNTSSLPSGNYFMVINADDKVTFKKFTVVK